MNYGLFLSLLIEELREAFGSQKTPAVATLMIIGAMESIIILDGFWEVFGVGILGAFLAELLILYNQRKKRDLRLPTHYWILTALMTAAGGVVAIAHGIKNVSFLLALQLGASAPLVIKRFRANE